MEANSQTLRGQSTIIKYRISISLPALLFEPLRRLAGKQNLPNGQISARPYAGSTLPIG